MENNDLFVEKYRPSTINSLIINDNLLNILLNIINSYNKNKKINNIILYGKPGIGKTTIINILINEYFKKIKSNKKYNDINYSDIILIINAANQRNLKIISENSEIETFCKINILAKELNRIIFFDEADNITENAQYMINNFIIENKHKNIIFMFTCNNVNKIIDKLKSNCILINCENIPKKIIFNKCKSICKKEKINISDEQLKKIIISVNNDIRKILYLLQNYKYNNSLTNVFIINEMIEKFFKKIIINTEITKDIINDINKICDLKINLKLILNKFIDYINLNKKKYNIPEEKIIKSNKIINDFLFDNINNEFNNNKEFLFIAIYNLVFKFLSLNQ